MEEQCIRIIEFEENTSLYDLHDAIQDAVSFGRDHPFTFYIANSWRGQRQWLTEEEKWQDKEHDFSTIKLKDIYPLGRKKLYYLFDFGDQWTFEVRKARGSKKPLDGVSYCQNLHQFRAILPWFSVNQHALGDIAKIFSELTR